MACSRITALTSLTQLLKNKEAPDVIPPFSLANLGFLIFFEFGRDSGHSVADDSCRVGVDRGLYWNMTTYLLLSERIARITNEWISWMTSYWVIVI